MRRAAAALVALVLCCGLAPAVPAGSGAAGTAHAAAKCKGKHKHRHQRKRCRKGSGVTGKFKCS